MKDIDTIEQFISLRAMGLTYKEITEKISVSRPTLVKWNKEYDYEIKLAERDMLSALFSKTLVDNKVNIFHNVNLIRRYEIFDEKTEWANKVYLKACDRLEKLFCNKINKIKFTFTKNENFKTIEFTFKKKYLDSDYDHDLDDNEYDYNYYNEDRMRELDKKYTITFKKRSI